MKQTVLFTLSQEELNSIIETTLIKFQNQSGPQKIEEDDVWLDTKEAANLIKYKESSIYGLVKRKKIPYCKQEGKLLFSKKQLFDWVTMKKSD